MKPALVLTLAFAAAACSQPADKNAENGNNEPASATRTGVAIDSVTWRPAETAWIDFGEKSIYTVRSAKELAALVREGSEPPRIDFSRQSAVIAGGTLTHGYGGIGAMLEIGEKDGLLTVEIMPDETTIAPPWRVVVYTAPIPAGIDVALDLRMVAPGDSISLRSRIPTHGLPVR